MMESAKAVYPEVGVYVCFNEATGQCRISYELETDVDVSEICLYMTAVLNSGAVYTEYVLLGTVVSDSFLAHELCKHGICCHRVFVSPSVCPSVCHKSEFYKDG